MFAKADSPFKSLDDVIAYARKKPGELICGIAQIGSNSHLESLQLIASGKDRYHARSYQRDHRR